MTKKGRKRRLRKLGRKLELVYHFERSFVPYLAILGKMCALRGLLPQMKEHFSKEELEKTLLLLEALRHCSEVMEENTK
ncbi:hypothetical protein [Cyclobacterium xiamenense]|uniref:hypothetical protein n=1 Tax=Cyclobacterium xiamenense TaxID=1297121 RepID=UPI0035D1273E